MNYKNVCIEAVVNLLPEEIVTTDAIEERLAPVYDRLRLPPGRLELMTGIRERRLWPKGILPGSVSVQTVKKALEQSGVDPQRVGALIHGSVCRDYLEPATACGVHEGAGLPEDCQIFDVSNACLGILTGMIQAANMIELGQIDAAVVVGTEDSRSLLETTIDQMLSDPTLTRQSIKPLFASLTIGSASAGFVLVKKDLSRTGMKLLGASVIANTAFCHLCRSDASVKEGDAMKTDSETLLIQGAIRQSGFSRSFSKISAGRAARSTISSVIRSEKRTRNSCTTRWRSISPKIFPRWNSSEIPAPPRFRRRSRSAWKEGFAKKARRSRCSGSARGLIP